MRTFAIITTDANELVAEIHDRMPLILAPADYTRWLSDEPDAPIPSRADADVANLPSQRTTTPQSSSRSS
jgi:putative SOS response-associated peptidase YedK